MAAADLRIDGMNSATGSRIGAPAPDETPFGHFAPTAAQAALIALANGTPLGRGALRWTLSSLLEALRPGPVDVVRNGLKLRLHHAGANATDKKLLFASDDFDRPELDAILRHTGPRLSFADIGANSGGYALTVKARCPDASIAAFEAVPANAARLAFNVRANALSDFAVIPAAVGTARGTAQFFLDDASLLGTGPAITVPVVPLYESLVECGFTKLDALKIDIEGFEDRVLFAFFECASEPLRPRVMIVEHTHSHLWKNDVFALTRSLGYREVGRTKANAIIELGSSTP